MVTLRVYKWVYQTVLSYATVNDRRWKEWGIQICFQVPVSELSMPVTGCNKTKYMKESCF